MREMISDLSIKTYDETGNIIDTWDEEKGWLEDGSELNEAGEWRMTQIYHPYSDEELVKIMIEKDKANLVESRKQFTLDEVVTAFMHMMLNTVDIPDQTSLRMMAYYPTFEEIIGDKVKMGFKFIYDNKMYKTIQPDLTIQENYIPCQGTESLYARVDLEHTGAIYDPIPYDKNMELFKGKYYTQFDIIYLCIKNSGQALYHNLKDLVGIYVDIVDTDGNIDSQGSIESTIPEFKQPTGAHDAYHKGDLVLFKGKKYESLIDNNVYSPEVYAAGWKEIN